MATGNVSLNCCNMTNDHNIAGVVNKNPEIKQWISPIDPRRRYQDVSTDRSGGVGNWLLEGVTKVGNSVLFCYGNPGVGKAYLK